MFSKRARLVGMSLVGALTMCGSQESAPTSPPAPSPTGTPADAAPVPLPDGGGGSVHADGGDSEGGTADGGVRPRAVKFGVFARLSPGPPAFGMFSSKAVLDSTKTMNILDIGATWTRGSMSPFFTDQTIYGAGHYDWSAADIVLAWNQSNGMEPFIGIEAGPVQVNDSPPVFAPHTVDRYPTATAFATYCGAAAAHFSAAFHSYSIPGNEINTNPQQFPTVADAASYMSACYAAIKSADPSAFIYGLELNMDGQAGATAYVKSLTALGCGPGTCYDGISAHLSLRYPIPPAGTPCYPNAGGDYTVACLADLRAAAGAPVPIMVGETAVTWPGMVPDAATQALAAPVVLKALAAAPGVRYINYANLDECSLYPSGYFMNGCIVDVNNARVPAWQGVHDVFAGK